MGEQGSSLQGRRHDHRQEQLLSRVVEELCTPDCEAVLRRPAASWQHELPARDEVVRAVVALRSVFFPGYFGPSELTEESARYHVGATLSSVRQRLVEQVKRGLRFGCRGDPGECPDCSEERALKTVDAFMARLPEIKRLLATDVKAAYQGDPAATSPDEAIFCYPGVLANTSHRVAHELHKLGVPLLPRIVAEHAHSITGIDIHPGASIDESFFIDHGTGVVVGETCAIGKRVQLYQGVTLGAKNFPLDEHGNPIKGIPRHPIVEDDVVIYGGATILGRVTIGKGSVIGGNVWLTRSVPPGSKVLQAKVPLEVFSEGTGI